MAYQNFHPAAMNTGESLLEYLQAEMHRVDVETIAEPRFASCHEVRNSQGSQDCFFSCDVCGNGASGSLHPGHSAGTLCGDQLAQVWVTQPSAELINAWLMAHVSQKDRCRFYLPCWRRRVAILNSWRQATVWYQSGMQQRRM